MLPALVAERIVHWCIVLQQCISGKRNLLALKHESEADATDLFSLAQACKTFRRAVASAWRNKEYVKNFDRDDLRQLFFHSPAFHLRGTLNNLYHFDRKSSLEQMARNGYFYTFKFHVEFYRFGDVETFCSPRRCETILQKSLMSYTPSLNNFVLCRFFSKPVQSLHGSLGGGHDRSTLRLDESTLGQIFSMDQDDTVEWLHAYSLVNHDGLATDFARLIGNHQQLFEWITFQCKRGIYDSVDVLRVLESKCSVSIKDVINVNAEELVRNAYCFAKPVLLKYLMEKFPTLVSVQVFTKDVLEQHQKEEEKRETYTVRGELQVGLEKTRRERFLAIVKTLLSRPPVLLQCKVFFFDQVLPLLATIDNCQLAWYILETVQPRFNQGSMAKVDETFEQLNKLLAKIRRVLLVEEKKDATQKKCAQLVYTYVATHFFHPQLFASV